MNNSWALSENSERQILPDVSEKLRVEESRVLRIIEAIQETVHTKAWSTLKNEVFDKLESSLEKELRAEAKKDDPDPRKLNRLSGELKWAERYSDLSKLESAFKAELQRIRSNPSYGN
jgi:hypothetical protein